MRERSRREVVAPDGRTWTVGVRWLPRRPRWLPKQTPVWRRSREDWLEGAAQDIFIFVILVVAIVVLAALALALEALALFLFAVIAASIRVLFRRPWAIEATTSGERREWKVVGLRASRDTLDDVAGALEAGTELSGFTVP